MATAKKTPSGAWKVRVYSHTTPDGKKHYKAFTAATKQQAEQDAAQFAGTKHRAARTDMTVAEAIDQYIGAKSAVLSPTTVRGYQSLARNYFDRIGARRITRLTTQDVQQWVSDLSATVSPKTISNAYGFFTAVICFYLPGTTFPGIKLPARKKKRPVAPSDAQVIALYNAASPNLKKAIALEAFTSMRRSEVCGLRYGDITDGIAHVQRAMVHGIDGGWIIKDTPKTSDSDRFTRIPEQVLELIGTGEPDERVVPVTPDTITELFCRLRTRLGMTLRYHDLRHYYASIAAVLQIPTAYVESFGGWRAGSTVLKATYENTIAAAADQYGRQISAHFDAIIPKV